MRIFGADRNQETRLQQSVVYHSPRVSIVISGHEAPEAAARRHSGSGAA